MLGMIFSKKIHIRLRVLDFILIIVIVLRLRCNYPCHLTCQESFM